MKLAKNGLDVGLFTNGLDSMMAFWGGEVGLPFEETLPVGGGVRQHRHGLLGSVLKLNHARDPLDPLPPGGYRELWIAREGIEGEVRLRDPDGNAVVLVAPGTRGIERIGIVLAVRDEAAHHAFFRDALGLESVGERGYRWGSTQIFLEADPSIPADAPESCNRVMKAPGYRYVTVQVWDADAEYEAAVARGALPAQPPVTLGKVARIAFIRDPDGNWIEISQRASLTGELR